MVTQYVPHLNRVFIKYLPVLPTNKGVMLNINLVRSLSSLRIYDCENVTVDINITVKNKLFSYYNMALHAILM